MQLLDYRGYPSAQRTHHRRQLGTSSALPALPQLSYYSSSLALRATRPSARRTLRQRTVPTAAMPAPLVGGVLIGGAAAGSLLLNGRVLGVSGAVKGLVQGERQGWRAAFLLGLLLPVPLLAAQLPSALIQAPVTMTVYRALASGLLVGLGSALANGCTSGHGVCGNARLSPRSLAFTLTIIAAGAASVWAFNSAAVLGMPAVAPGITPASSFELSIAAALLAGSVGALALSALVFKVLRNGSTTGPTWITQAADLLAAALISGMFSTGLMISGMTDPTRVVGFLSMGTPAWDPSLTLVMAGAVGMSILPYQWIMGRFFKPPAMLAAPILATSYSLPSNATPIDAKLLLGALLFGTGWGMSGLCPGPALVSAVGPMAGGQVWAFLLGMFTGMTVEPTVSRSLPKTTPSAAAAVPSKQYSRAEAD